MTTELIFFDIDDTLCRLGKLDDNNLATLRKLREKGIQIVIATGRGTIMLPSDIHKLIDEKVVDGVICTNGQYNVVGDKLISRYPLNKNDTAKIAQICNHFALPYQQLSENHIAWSERVPQYDFAAEHFADSCVIDADYHQKHTIYQFSVFLSETEEHAHEEYSEAFAALGYHFTRWQKGGADILPNGASKARGIDDVCQYLNVEIANTMAFGDGLNDIEMLQHVNIGVAMGDGWQRLKNKADYVTGTIEENGIYQALKHFQVL